MQEYKWLITIGMLLCIIATFIPIIILQYKANLKNQNQYEAFKKEKDLNINDIYNDKGRYGEFKVFKIFDNYFNDDTRIFNNVNIPKINKTTTEVDLIAINEKAIIIVEVKNLYGIITGDKDDKNWNQQLNDNLNQELYNPIMQNENHIKHFKRNLDLSKYNLSDKNIYSLIVFGDKSNINSVRYNDENIRMVNINELKDTLDLIIQSNDVVLSNIQITQIADIIEEFEERCSEVIE